jgi:hypothetical protein
MTIANNTRYAALGVPIITPSGKEVALVVVKATYLRRPDGTLVVAPKQTPVRPADDVLEPGKDESSVRYPGDICTDKPGTDVVIVGEAVSSKPVAQLDVGVRVQDRNKLLRVHGERVFYKGAFGLSIGPAAPFTRMPITYERAYGGKSKVGHRREMRNPVGRGFDAAADDPAPQIEDPRAPISTALDRPPPTGIGAISSHWSPRLERMGTFDQAWREKRIPLMPLDFDARSNSVASDGLWFEAGLPVGATIGVTNMTPTGAWSVQLPAMPIRLAGKRRDGSTVEARPRVDTVLIEPLEDRVELTCRMAFPMGRGKTLLGPIVVDEELS